MSLNLSAGEGVGAGIAAGGVAAAVAAFALGPIGLAAGLVGFLVGKLTKKSNCISEAKSKISGLCSSNKKPILDSLIKNKKYYSDALNSHLESSFVSHHGKNHNQIVKHIIDADSTVNNLSCLPSKPKYLVPIGMYSSFKFVNSNGNKWSVYYYNNGAGQDWDGAVVDEWKKSTIPVLKKRLVEIDTAAFHPDNLSKIKSELLNGVRKKIISQVTGADWSNTENGLTVSISDIILNSGAAKKIKEMLPNANDIITGTGNKRLDEMKHHNLNMKEHFTKTFNSSLSTLVGNFNESIVIRLPRYAMMAMLAVALLVYCSRYVDTTWIKIVFQCGGVVGIWSIYANNHEQDSFFGVYMFASLIIILTTIWYFNILVFYLLFSPAVLLSIYMIIAYANLYSRAKEDSNKAFDKYINKLNTESMQLISRGLNI